MIEVTINESEYSRQAHIKPQGFWTDVVRVCQSQSLGTHDCGSPEISWSSGGGDGTVTREEMVDNFIEALVKAKEIASKWKKEREEGDECLNP